MTAFFFLAAFVPIQRAAPGVRRPPTNQRRGAKRREFSTPGNVANGAAVRRFLPPDDATAPSALHSFAAPTSAN